MLRLFSRYSRSQGRDYSFPRLSGQRRFVLKGFTPSMQKDPQTKGPPLYIMFLSRGVQVCVDCRHSAQARKCVRYEGRGHKVKPCSYSGPDPDVASCGRAP